MSPSHPDRVRKNYEPSFIRCPICTHVCGNIVDEAKRITLKCQYCGYDANLPQWQDVAKAMQRYDGMI